MSVPCCAAEIFDVVVIGSGPAGQKAAIQAAKAGRRVAVIERDRQVGGSCVHTGTIPSKSLREHALRQRVRHVDLMDEPIQSLLDGVGATIAAHDAYMSAQLERNHIRLMRGRANFTAPNELAIRRIDGSNAVVRAGIIIIATGSRPRTPPHLAVDHEHVLDSDSILSLAYLPRSLLVLGGGVIASEYAATFAALGCKVTQADQYERPLGFLDPELTSFYVDELRRNGGEYIPNADAVVDEVGWHLAGAHRLQGRPQPRRRQSAGGARPRRQRRRPHAGCRRHRAHEPRPHPGRRRAQDHRDRRLRRGRRHRPARARVRVDGTGTPRRLPCARVVSALGSRVAPALAASTPSPRSPPSVSTSTKRAGTSAAPSSGARGSRKSRAGRSMVASAAF